MNDQQFNTFMQQINHQELMDTLKGKKPVERQYRKIDNYMPTIIDMCWISNCSLLPGEIMDIVKKLVFCIMMFPLVLLVVGAFMYF